MRTLFLLCLLAGLIVLPACDSFVEGTDDPIDSISDDDLTEASQVPFLVNGVQDRFAESLDDLTFLAGGLSDELFFDQDVPNATFPTFAQTDAGDFRLDNNSVDAALIPLYEYRLLADTLITRIEGISELSPEEGGFAEGDTLREAGLFIANLHGGIARYFLGTYFSLDAGPPSQAQPGAPINRSPLIPQSELYAQAITKMQEALQYTSDAYATRVVNSLIARIYLFSGDYANAQQFAQQGLQEGDAPYQALYNVQDENGWYFAAGPGRSQFVADARFAEYDEGRTPVTPIEGNSGATYYVQALYTQLDSPITFMSWQETALMLAEVALRDGNDAQALELVNQVRASHDLDALDSIDMDGIITERDKELFGEGIRLVDQRRFDRWHLGANSWRFLPITEGERTDNPNLN